MTNIAGIESDSGIGVIWPEPLIVLLNWPKSFTWRPVVTKKYFCPVRSSWLKVTVLPLVVVFAIRTLVNCSVGLNYTHDKISRVTTTVVLLRCLRQAYPCSKASYAERLVDATSVSDTLFAFVEKRSQSLRRAIRCRNIAIWSQNPSNFLHLTFHV